jgi:elongation factor 1 alpha-like protein
LSLKDNIPEERRLIRDPECHGKQPPTLEYSKRFSTMDFFKDTPWLNVPIERQSVFIAPPYLRGGLLGGSSDKTPKISKLQALAAARKKNAQRKTGASSDVDQPMTGLRLSQDDQGMKEEKSTSKTLVAEPAPSANKQPSRGFPVRKRKNPSPHRKTSQPAEPIASEPKQKKLGTPVPIPSVDQAKPSAFASTMT